MSRTNLELFAAVILVLLTGGMLIAYGLQEPQRMAEFDKSQQGQAIEVGAQLFDTNCKGCHGVKGEGTPGLCPPLNDKNFFTNRLKDVGWSGTLQDYIVSTVSAGRLVSTRPDLYPGQGKPAMPAWSDRYGGPLRDDQIADIAAFIMNWESTAPTRTVTVTLAGPPVGTDITQTLPQGDANRGQALANSKGCVACHITTAVGPAWAASGTTPGIGSRAAERIKESDYTGKATTPEQYLLESIVDPKIHIVSGFQPLMPANFGQTLTAQDVADLIAYLQTFK